MVFLKALLLVSKSFIKKAAKFYECLADFAHRFTISGYDYANLAGVYLPSSKNWLRIRFSASGQIFMIL